MTINHTRRRLVAGIGASTLAGLWGCGSSAGQSSARGAVLEAAAQAEATAKALMQRTGIPGLAMAVVHGDETVYARGFGVRAAGSSEPVDADTVFQLASMSKPLGATVVAHEVGSRGVAWDSRMLELMPGFALKDAAVSAQLTVGDLYAHRSGLPDHAGDTLEELGFGQQAIFQRLRQLSLTPFRASYNYTNYGMTAAGVAVARAAGTDWFTLSERVLYEPLGMRSTSSRFADFRARPNRALGHVKEGGRFVVGPERPAGTGAQRWSAAYDTDAQSPSGGASSSVRDLARWMSLLLARGMHEGRQLVDAAALDAAMRPQQRMTDASDYGFGFFINASAAGRMVYSHGGAFAWGASTYFTIMPSLDVGIVVLTNAWPTGVVESVASTFNDILDFGAPQRDWFALYSAALDQAFLPQGSLAGQPPPVAPQPPRAAEAYLGNWTNDYHGVARVEQAAAGLQMRLGPNGQTVYALRHWSGDTFTFVPLNDSATPGSVSRADFTPGGLVLEHYNHNGLGVFSRG